MEPAYPIPDYFSAALGHCMDCMIPRAGGHVLCSWQAGLLHLVLHRAAAEDRVSTAGGIVVITLPGRQIAARTRLHGADLEAAFAELEGHGLVERIGPGRIRLLTVEALAAYAEARDARRREREDWPGHAEDSPMGRLLVAAGCTCHYCGRRGDMRRDPNGGSWQRDHVLPRSRGGRSRPENIVLACARCNGRKGALTGEEFRAKLARNSSIKDRGDGPTA